MHRQVQNKLAGYLTKRGLGLVIALDQAQVAGSRILAGRFIALSSLRGNQNILGGKSQVQHRHRRGFLTPLCATLGVMRATLVVLGTSLSLQDADYTYSAVGKRTNFHRIMQFPLFDDQDVEDVLLELIDISDCTLLHVKRRKAFDSAADLAKTELRRKVRELLENDRTGDVIHLLGRMLMDEPLVVEVVEEELDRSNADPALSEHLRQLDGIIENLGINSSAKGNALEPLVQQSLRRFSNFYLADLPFLKNIKLPTWCSGLKLQIDEINTACGFGYKAEDTEANLKFLIDHPSNKLLVQQSGARQDGAWFFSDNRYAGSLAIKFYSNAKSQTDHSENKTSSDIRCSFLRADGMRESPSLKKIRDNFVASGANEIKGILRIHLEIPRVQGMQLATHVKRDPATGTEDLTLVTCGTGLSVNFMGPEFRFWSEGQRPQLGVHGVPWMDRSGFD
ncbi:hypothetical protein BGZ74_001844 [Mortierella antarctica]|nr:hypothetical protein BGZ74_001844 [Mortierella antarctica]